MPKITQFWVLFTYTEKNRYLRLSKPFSTRAEAEKARLKHPERERGKIGIGMVRKVD
jgi:hypothetical protein